MKRTESIIKIRFDLKEIQSGSGLIDQYDDCALVCTLGSVRDE